MASPTTRGTLEAFATQAAIAIESARLYAESAEKSRIERELRIAADIQRALLPEANYDSAMCDVAAASVSSSRAKRFCSASTSPRLKSCVRQRT